MKPVAWTLRRDLGATTCRAHLWATDPVNTAWVPLFTREAMDAAVDAERERWIAKAGMAYTDAHAIFNDPPSETAQEVRDVIEWHLATMRAYTESP